MKRDPSPPAQLASAPPEPASSALPAQPSEPRQEGSLDLASEPPAANVYLEGELITEVTPATLRKLPLGRPLHIRIARAGYEPYQADVTLSPDKPRDRIAAKLAPATLTLHLVLDAPDAAVWIDGKFTSARTITGLTVDQDHRVAVSAPGRIGKILMLRSEVGGDKRLELRLDPVKGSR
jgi:hypothetical protein